MKRRQSVWTSIYSLFLFVLVGGTCGQAQDVYILGGAIKNTKGRENSFAVQVEASESLGNLFVLSLSYLNEGHFAEHHRDGIAGQIWIERDVDGRLSLSAGLGPYIYFATIADSDESYMNDHGIGAMTSMAATYAIGEQALVQLRGNWILAGDINTVSILLGGGYRFSPLDKKTSFPKLFLAKSATPRNAINVLVGRTIVNSFGSELSSPINIEYRRKLLRHMELTVAGLYEGCNTMINRYGPTAQFWIIKEFLDERLTFSVGIGCYYAFDRKPDAPHNATLAGLVSATACYRFDPYWNMRLTFNRVITDYNRDSDVLLLGPGYQF